MSENEVWRKSALEREEKGYFAGWVAEAKANSLYGFRIDEQPQLISDPASRFQPQGPQGPSQVIDPGRFPWSDTDWSGMSREGQVIYEMHFGTFTAEGTYTAAAGAVGGTGRIGCDRDGSDASGRLSRSLRLGL